MKLVRSSVLFSLVGAIATGVAHAAAVDSDNSSHTTGFVVAGLLLIVLSALFRRRKRHL